MKITIAIAVCLLLAGPIGAHDMFLVIPDHDFPPDSAVTVSLYNGTFIKSENTIDRDRLADVTVIDGEGEVTHPALDRWRDDGTVTLLSFQAGAPGTHVVGVSTKPKMIELSAEDFNEYLEHDGVVDVLEARRKSGSLGSSARERYAKHVKTILQVGDEMTGSWAHRFGYPVEIVPKANPSGLCPGDSLEFEVLAEGRPAIDQLVYASYEGYDPNLESGGHREAVSTRTDAAGVGRIELAKAGRWYLRLIRMVESPDDGVEYESNWATLTFEAKCANGD
jgi:uncharacterized GH25 family protein